MDPITATAMLGVGTGGLGYLGQLQTNSMNQQMLTQSENWMEGMSNTAHQREVADLKSAGLNPILSAGGSGASTPQVSPVTMTSPIQAASSSAMSGIKAAADMTNAVATARKAEASAKLDEANTQVAQATAGIKRPEAAAMQDFGTVYGRIRDSILDFLDRQGVNQTGARGIHLRQSSGGDLNFGDLGGIRY